MELPHVEKLYRELKDKGFGLLTITSDSNSSVMRMVTYNGITHPIVTDLREDSTSIYKRYQAYDGKHYLIGSDLTIKGAFSKLGISIPLLRQRLIELGVDAKKAEAPLGKKAGQKD